MCFTNLGKLNLFAHGGSILSSGQFLLLPWMPQNLIRVKFCQKFIRNNHPTTLIKIRETDCISICSGTDFKEELICTNGL